MKKSFTLIELIISLGILGLILGISTPFLISFNVSQELDSITEELSSVIWRARGKSMRDEKDAGWGVDFSQPQKYILFRDNPTGLLLDMEIYEIPRNISLATNYNPLKFEKLKGVINQNFEAILMAGDKRYKITINQEGVIEYQKR